MRSLGQIALAILLLSAIAPAQPFYSGVYGSIQPSCQACHANAQPPNNQCPLWNETDHSRAYDSHTEVQTDPNCLPCHTTGWDTTLANHGFDDFFFTGNIPGMQQTRNVQCESCHGPTDQFPHLATTVVDYHAEACGGCHSGFAGRHTYEEWSLGQHGQIASASAQQLACAKCHEAISAAEFLQSGSAPINLPSNPLWQITCAACHAAHLRESFGFQLYQPEDSTCRSCHTLEDAVPGVVPHSPQAEMLMGTANPDTLQLQQWQWSGYVYNTSCHECLPGCPIPPCVYCHMYATPSGNPQETSGHNLQPQIESCAAPSCHADEIPPDSSFNINNGIGEIDSLLGVLAAALAQADTTTPEYTRAQFDYDFVVNDGSHGVHNFLYAEGLLISSIEGLAQVGVKSPGPTLTIPADYFLGAVHPHPFNPTTTIEYGLAQAVHVNLRVYNLSGKLMATLANSWQAAGQYQIAFDGSQLPSGIYIYHLRAGNYHSTKKMILLK